MSALDRSTIDGNPMPYCTGCAAPLPEAFCAGCGKAATVDPDRVIPVTLMEDLRAAASMAGLLDENEVTAWLADGQDPVFAVSRSGGQLRKPRLIIGKPNRQGKVTRQIIDCHDIVVTPYRIAAHAKPSFTQSDDIIAKHAAANGYEVADGADGLVVHRPLVDVIGHRWQSGTPWSFFTYFAPAHDGTSGAVVQWKTGPGAIATLAVGALLYQNDSTGATDRLATVAGMGAYQHGSAALSHESVFAAVETVGMFPALKRGGMPVI